MRPDQSPAKGKFAPLASCDADDSDSDNEALLHAAATAVGGGGGQNAHRGASPVASTTGGYVLQFFALPSQVFVILLLEFLNSYRNFGLRFVQYQYINNEFSMGDIETGSLLGIKSTMDIVFGIIGSLATDAFGVRKTAIVALLMSVVGRGIFTFARSSWWLWLASMTFSPFGEAMLGTGIYTVALKKMTPPKLRPLAFAVQYASFNFSGALCDVVIDYLRMQDDREVFGMRFSGLRTFIFTTWVAVWAALLLVIFGVKDYTVIDPDDPEEATDGLKMPDCDIDGRPLSEPSPPLAAPSLGGYEVAGQPTSAKCSSCGPVGRAWRWRQRATTRYRILHTPLRTEGVGVELRAIAATEGRAAAVRTALRWACGSAGAVLRLRALWVVVCFSLATFFVSKQWGDTETMLIPFLERHFGENVPIYTIHSINLWGCLLFPPLVGALTGARETFSVILPGMWLMAFSPVFITLSPTVLGAVLWLVFLTLGEVAWSPRHSAWAASVAPVGREGVFVAVASIKSLLITWPSNWFNGFINDRWNPNCKKCRDSVGHFCDVLVLELGGHNAPNATASVASALEAATVSTAVGPEEYFCASQSGDGERCRGLSLSLAALSTTTSREQGNHTAAQLLCPSTCRQCPGWSGEATMGWLWGTVLVTSLWSPLLVWLVLPFLRTCCAYYTYF